MTDLKQWLASIGLSQHADLFAQHEVEYETLLDLEEQDLEKLGVPLGHRKKLLKAIAQAARASSRGQHLLAADEEPAAKIGADRRHLTVLMCDLVDSTALSAQLDPEDLRQILRVFQGCCGEAIRRYEGHIARFMGDAVLAYFGFPAAHEDDAERAVSASLEIVQSVSRLSSPNTPLAVRIGIASGLVIVGDLIGEGPAREFALVGEAPNLAARLQALANPNQILMAPQTRRLIGRMFELADLGEHRVKGLEHEVRVWRVLRPSSIETRFEARQPSQPTPMIGREAELAVLLEQYRKAEGGQGQIVLIAGEPGIGKSRLAVALRKQLARDAYCPPAFQCSSYHTSSAWHPHYSSFGVRGRNQTGNIFCGKAQQIGVVHPTAAAKCGFGFTPFSGIIIHIDGRPLRPACAYAATTKTGDYGSHPEVVAILRRASTCAPRVRGRALDRSYLFGVAGAHGRQRARVAGVGSYFAAP
jgi:class 3 adenylate cyclase